MKALQKKKNDTKQKEQCLSRNIQASWGHSNTYIKQKENQFIILFLEPSTHSEQQLVLGMLCVV